VSANDTVFLLLRVVVVASLYGFLAAVLLIVVRDIRRRPLPTAASRPRVRGRLIVVGGQGRTGAEFTLGDVTTIGRDAASAIALEDDYVSSRHAAIVWRDGQLVLSDLDSTNGTQVNDVRVVEPVELNPGDIVSIGTHRLKVAKPR
jgi:hypothetical protein